MYTFSFPNGHTRVANRGTKMRSCRWCCKISVRRVFDSSSLEEDCDTSNIACQPFRIAIEAAASSKQQEVLQSSHYRDQLHSASVVLTFDADW